MSELERLAARAERILEAIARNARLLLEAGADPGYVRRAFLEPAADLYEELQVRALLAAGGDPQALAATRRLTRDLTNLQLALRSEVEGYPDAPEI